jgi:uncharacterized protein
MRTESYGSVKVYWPEFTRDELIAQLREKAPALAAQLPLNRVTLFGSWAHNQATAFSDVGVLVVYAGPPRDDAYKLACNALHVEGLEAHVYSEQEAEPLAATLERMTAGSVDLLDGD